MWDQVLPEQLSGVRHLPDGRTLAVIPPDGDGGRYSLVVVAPDFPAVEGTFVYDELEAAAGDMGAWTPGADSPRPPRAVSGEWKPFQPT